MSSPYPVLQSRPVAPYIRTTCNKCNFPLEFPLPNPTPKPATLLRVRCYQCSSILDHAFYPNQVPESSSVDHRGAGSSSSRSGPSGNTTGNSVSKKGRRIGTDENPIETGYYDLLGVPINATLDDIKKAYRALLFLLVGTGFLPQRFYLCIGRLAIKFHPDKNRDDPNAEELFKEIAIAYQTLSDPTLRKKYNEFGPKESAPEGGYVDPEEVFGAIFGGDRFVPIIGTISLAKDMKTALQEAEDNTDVPKDAKGKEILSPEEKARRDEKAKKVSAEVSILLPRSTVAFLC
jgi:DnaJ domain